MILPILVLIEIHLLKNVKVGEWHIVL